jgi:hypothetical protein
MEKLFDSPYLNFALAELDPSKLRGSPNVDPGGIKITVTHNSRLDSSRGRVTKKGSLLKFEPLFLNHREVARKDEAPAFLPGVLQGDRRQRQAVSELDWLIIDLDKGEDISGSLPR